VNGPNPHVGGHWQNHAAGSAGHVHPDDPIGLHDPVHADPASVTADSAQHVHDEDGNSIAVQHRHDHDQMTTSRAAGTLMTMITVMSTRRG
jgi:hypothetical protein